MSKKLRLAINGYGRIGRNILRAWLEEGYESQIEIVAFNNRGDIKTHAHLTQYDTVHGRFNYPVECQDEYLSIGDHRIQHLQQLDPEKLPWRELKIDLVLECTGKFTTKNACQKHLNAGAKKVLISAPAKGEVDKTVVYGVNHTELLPEHLIVSNASCTTNCLAPLISPIFKAVGIESGLMTTTHAYTNDQVLIDSRHKDLRRARSAHHSIIPTKTGAAAAIGLVIPGLKGKLDGFALRVPTANVSMVDFTFLPTKITTIEQIHQILRSAALNEMKGILSYTEKPLVSIDYNHATESSIFDATLSRKMGRLFKICSWYDNEWAFSVRMLDVALLMINHNDN